jgi:hypothetical protein
MDRSGWVPDDPRGVRVVTRNSIYLILDHQFFQRLPPTEGVRPQPTSIQGRLQDQRVVPYRALRWEGPSLQIIPGIGPRHERLARGIITSEITSIHGRWVEDAIGDDNQPLVSWVSLGADGGQEHWAKLIESPRRGDSDQLEFYESNTLIYSHPVPSRLEGAGESLLLAALDAIDADA